MSDYDKEVLTASSLLERLNTIEARLNGLAAVLNDVEQRLDSIMHGADVRNHRYYKLEEDYNRQLSKCAVTQATIKTIEEKLNAID